MDNEKGVYSQERELLHRQLELLAEQSKGCMPSELAELSAQMVTIYSILYPDSRRYNYTDWQQLKPKLPTMVDSFREALKQSSQDSSHQVESDRKKETLQSIDSTLKCIEVLLHDFQKKECHSPLQALQDAVAVSFSGMKANRGK